ncbi:MAG: zinc ribbon domain-containing protein [Planctomycetaceae bacterium]|jgi:putative FmdB family regulatory protein|nr:zinc ribbon domain-containing protein [Planctomycetaceae bacterium]MCP4816565.1 zinc ribbon domain-containing protein [Planctomycetaceae bacterium]
MPIYEYSCCECRHEFEILVRASESPSCPQCSSEQLGKLFSVPAAPNRSSGSHENSRLPTAGCGLPQCGSGGCAGLS